jgi:hypothetical protein
MTDTAAKVKRDFDSLVANYRRMTQILLDGLAPGVPQEQRNEIRKLFTPFVKATAAKPGDKPGGDTTE